MDVSCPVCHLQLTDKRMAMGRFINNNVPDILVSRAMRNMVTGHLSEPGEDWCALIYESSVERDVSCEV